MVTRQSQRRWQADDLEQFRVRDDGRRYEVIDGVLLVTPAPSAYHQLAVGELFARLHPYVRREELGFVVLAPSDLAMDGAVVQPDLFVSRYGPDAIAHEWHTERSIPLVVEVLSDSTRSVDLREKRLLYSRCGVSDYWIVDLTEDRVFMVKGAGHAVEERRRIVWHPEGAAEPLTIDLAEYFDDVTIAPQHRPPPG